MKKIRLLSLLLAAAMLLVCFAGCTGGAEDDGTDPGTESTPAEQSQAPSDDDGQDEPADAAAYFPLAEEETEMSIWAALSMSMIGYFDSWGDYPVFQEYEEMTNVHIEFTEVSAMEGAEQFNIMVVSGEYTDMVLNAVGRYAGGATKALEDDVLIDIAGLIEENATEYWDLLNSDEEMRRSVYTDEGNILAIYGFSEIPEASAGLLIRQDWLDELGMEIPTTYEEIAEVAEAFKINYDCSMPILVDEKGLMYEYGAFVGGYGTKGFMINSPADIYSASEFYQIDGVLQCSFLDDGYRDFLAMMASWYEAGYFNSDWATIMGFQDAWVPYIMDNSSGIFYGTSSVMDYVYANHEDEGIKLTALAEPSLDGESVSQFFMSTSKRHNTASLSVTTQCEDPVLAVKWINGFFTDEGIILANWGVEDQSWAYDESGNIAFSELITNNDSGASLDTLLHIYAIYAEWPTLNVGSSYTLYDEDTLAVMEFWNNCGTGENLLPRGIALTTEESTQFSTLAADFETYASENIALYLMGGKDVMADWDNFKETLEGMNMSECMDIYQAALDRYYER